MGSSELGTAWSRLGGLMSQAVHVPDDLAQRLVAEAERRGVSIDEVVTEALIARFPDSGTNYGEDALEAFIGSGCPAGASRSTSTRNGPGWPTPNWTRAPDLGWP